jgi:hypothetical protein
MYTASSNRLNVQKVIYIICNYNKFHLPAYIPECHVEYSFNFCHEAARTEGEAPERAWSELNVEGASTKEMGPGGHQDTLDDSIDQINWQKFVDMGMLSACHY